MATSTTLDAATLSAGAYDLEVRSPWQVNGVACRRDSVKEVAVGWIRTSNPPVNRLTWVLYLVGLSAV